MSLHFNNISTEDTKIKYTEINNTENDSIFIL